MFSGLINETALLESLDWDEEAYEQLVEFISSQNLLFIPTHPQILLDQIEEFFGERTRKVLEEIFKKEVKVINSSGDVHEN